MNTDHVIWRALDALAEEFERDMSVQPDASTITRVLASIPHAERMATVDAWRDANLSTRMIAASVVYATVAPHASREDLVDPLAGLTTLAQRYAMLVDNWYEISDELDRLRTIDAELVGDAIREAITWSTEQDPRAFGPDGRPRGRKASTTSGASGESGQGGQRRTRDYSAVPEGTTLANPADRLGDATYVDGILMVRPHGSTEIMSLSKWAREGHAEKGNHGSAKSASGTVHIRVESTGKSIVESCPAI